MKKLNAIAGMKCPQCYEGKLFTYGNPYRLSHLHEMPCECDQCGLNYNPEPGFYTGAMYVSYALSVALFVTSFIVTYVWLGVDVVTFFFGYATGILLLSPLLFRYSRTIYLHFFFHYRPEARTHYRHALALTKK